MRLLSDEERTGLAPTEFDSFPGPVPTQIVASEEFLPVPQTRDQREVEARLSAMADQLMQRQGMSRRHFFRTAAGMAAAIGVTVT